MKRTTIAPALIVFTMIAGNILAQKKAHGGLDKVKSLVGFWEGKRSDGNAVKVTYKLVSGGQGVMETLEAAGEDEMVSVYHPDGDKLALTHFCSSGNQPRLRANVPTGEIKNLNFAFVDATNLRKLSDGHIHGLSMSFQDKDHMTQVWTWRQDGQNMPMTFTLVRRAN